MPASVTKISSANYIPPMRIANKAETCEFFGIERTALNSWIRRGCPVLKKGARGQAFEMDLLAVAEWHFSPGDGQGDDFDPEKMLPKERLDWYRGCRERDNLRREQGELIHVKDVIDRWTGLISVAKGRLLALPGRMAPEVVGMENAREIERIIKDALVEILEELADDNAAGK